MSDEYAAELRAYAINMQHFIPHLERKKDLALRALLVKYNANEDCLREVAKLNALSELEMEISRKFREYETLNKEQK